MAERVFGDSMRMRDPAQQKRKKARAAVNAPGEFKIKGHPDFLGCTIADVGAGGLHLLTRSSLYVGDNLTVRFQMNGSPFECQATVTRSLGKAIGVQFENLTVEDEDRLQAFIHSALLERERKKP